MAGALKQGLDASATRVREIANRIANASSRSASFSLPSADAAGAPSADAGANVGGAVGTDVEADMARLAEEQARYEVTARLLSKAYAGLHSSMTERGS